MDKVGVLVLVLTSVVVGAVGQLLMKSGINAYGGIDFSDLKRFFLAFFQPKVFLGLSCYGLSSLLWVTALSHANLTFVYPLVSLGFVLTSIFGVFILKETVDIVKFAGISFIIIGAVLVGLGKFSG